MLPQSCGGNLRDLRVLLDRKLIDQRIKITTGSIRFALPNRASRAGWNRTQRNEGRSLVEFRVRVSARDHSATLEGFWYSFQNGSDRAIRRVL